MINVIWTNHLKDRARERGIDPTLVDKAIRFPDRVVKSSTTGSQKHIKTIGNREITASVKREGNNWIITSVWSKPSSAGGTYTPPLLERLVHRFVLWLEKAIRARLQS